MRAILVTDVPDAIRATVEADARKRNLSVNAVVTAILAQLYGVPWEPPAYPYTESGASEDWLVRMPEELRDAIRAHAGSLAGGSQRGCILRAVSAHYGLPEVSPRRRRDEVIDPEVVTAARARNGAGESLRSLAREYGVHRETLTRAVRAT